MDLEMVLNELSLRTTAPDILTARQWMSEFINTLSKATSNGVKRVLRTSDEINSIELAPSYPVARWRNDKEVDKEEKRFFIALTTKAPFWTDVAEEIKDEFDLSEVRYQGKEAKGLGFALIIDALAVSLKSKARWNCNRLELEVRRIDENDELIDEQVEITHASHKSHVQEHADWIKNRIRTGVRDGVELWNNREDLFPNLEFCESVSKQVQSIRKGQIELNPVVKALFELQKCCKTWNTGSFSFEGSPIEVSPESKQTLQNKKYKQQREFVCPDGVKRLFDLHVKLRFCNWRIYFCSKEDPGKVIIGYVGPHLSTDKYPT